MKKSIMCAAAVLLAGALLAGNSRILVTVPVNTLAATTTVTSAQLGNSSKQGAVNGVFYLFTAASVTGLATQISILTDNTNTLKIAAALSTNTQSSTTVATTFEATVDLGEKLVVTSQVTNTVPYSVLFNIKTSTP